jgi:hypothetical protein
VVSTITAMIPGFGWSFNKRLIQTAESWYNPGRCCCEVYCAVPLRGVKINCASDVLCCYFVLKCVLG